MVDYKSDDFKNVLSEINSPIKYTYLSLAGQDPALTAKAFKDLVMNDKEKSNYLSLPYFIPYLSKVDEVHFKDAIFPEIEFMMKRGTTLVSLITSTI